MNTPAHVIFGTAAFARPDHKYTTLAAIVGALVPDLSLYLFAGVSLFVLNIPEQQVFGDLYYSDAWQRVFAIDNSLVLWGIALLVALWFRSKPFIALTGAALLHILFDLPLHHDDGRAHFWPISDWVYQSPISYWDPHHYGGIVGPIEMAISVALCVVLWRRFSSALGRGLIVLLGLMEILPILIWIFVFSNPH